MEQLPTPLRVIGRGLSDWWDDWFNMIVINIAWMLCMVTIVLGPPATFGLYYVANQLVHGSSEGLWGWFDAGRRYFFKSWLYALINVAALIVLQVNFLFYGQFATAIGGFLQGIFLVLGIFWVIVQFYALPFIMEQKQEQIRLALRNGLFTMLAAPGYTLVMVIIVAIISVVSLVLVFPLFLGVPPLVAVIGNRAVLERLEAFGVREREKDGFDHEEDSA